MAGSAGRPRRRLRRFTRAGERGTMPLSHTMASHPHDREVAYAACVEAAVQLGAVAARHLTQRAGDSMLKRAAATPGADERKWLADAAQYLTRHQDTFRLAYQEALRREFADLERDDSPKARAVDFESLELMGEDQVDEAVELLRAQQVVASGLEADLAQLNALVSAAQGRGVVTAAANPFRPEAWVRALRHAAAQCSVPAWARVRWLQHLSEGMGTELSAIYGQLCDQLRQQGVTAAAFGVNPAAGDSGARPATPPGPAPRAASAPAVAASGPVLNLRDLRRLLIGDSADTGVGSLGTARAANDGPVDADPGRGPGSETVSGAMTVPFAFEALQEMKQLDEAMQRMRQRRVGADETWPIGGRGSTSAPSAVQVLSQEVVKLMVDNMAGDARLLPEVQQAVRTLEPALLRLARNDPRFFRDKQHAARRFLTEVTERSLAWPAADTPGFAGFLEPLRQAVDALDALRADNAEPFEFALRTLQDAWGEQEQRSRRARANAARTLVKAEKRNLIAQRIADSLKQRTDVAGASAEVRRFLTGPWSQVMAAAEMDEFTVTADPGGYSAVIGDLIWSTQPQATVEERIRLARLVPPMLAKLRGGLASIEYPADATRLFLDYLADIHQAALRPQGSKPMQAATAGSAAAEEDDEPEVWLEPTEALESGLMACFPVTASPAQPGSADTDRPASGAGVSRVRAAERLHEGVWVDLYIDETWSRWRVAWASPHALLFMFTDGSGKYKSMTRSVLDTMMGLGALRIISEQTLLAGALDAVAERALRNSMESAH